MRGIYKTHNAINTATARRDYDRLLRLAQDADLSALVPIVRSNAGWRTLDAAARDGVENLIKAKPVLREALHAIYPGLVSL